MKDCKDPGCSGARMCQDCQNYWMKLTRNPGEAYRRLVETPKGTGRVIQFGASKEAEFPK